MTISWHKFIRSCVTLFHAEFNLSPSVSSSALLLTSLVEIKCSCNPYLKISLTQNANCVNPYNLTLCDVYHVFSAPSVDCNAENGGCHVFAICSQTAVDKVNCSCKPGYHGDGYYCELLDVCLTNNGDCDPNATCLFTGPVSLQLFQ